MPLTEEQINELSRDVTKDLPKELRGRSLDPLPRRIVLRLSKSFNGLKGTALSEASLAVTVTK